MIGCTIAASKLGVGSLLRVRPAAAFGWVSGGWSVTLEGDVGRQCCGAVQCRVKCVCSGERADRCAWLRCLDVWERV